MEASDASDDPRRRRRRAIWVGLVVGGWLAVQLAVPAIALVERGGKPRPRTFAWQMFSHQLEAPAESFTVTTASGSRAVDVRPLLTGPMRREIRYAPALVPKLCEDPAVLSVTVVDVESGSTTVACR
ncbi:MAG: hypothetical protein R2702_06390 [Acidimicrobiales bacterium]